MSSVEKLLQGGHLRVVFVVLVKCYFCFFNI